MPNFQLGLSALRASQFSIDLVSNNVANANNEGYHRRRVHFAETEQQLRSGFRVGTGVTVSRVQRVRDQVTEASLTKVTSDSNRVEQLLTLQKKIESAVLTGGNAVGEQLDQFFTEFTSLSASPNEPAQQQALLETGNQLAAALRDASSLLNNLKQNVGLQIDNEIVALNDNFKALNTVNAKIARYAKQGIDHGNELDQRDRIINEIAEVIGVDRAEIAGGDLHLTIGTHSIHQGANAMELTVKRNNDQVDLVLGEAGRPMELETGRLSALVDTFNETIPAFEEKLDQLAAKLIAQVNAVQSTGIGTTGGFQNLIGSVEIDDSSIPLIDALPGATLSPGEITVSLTDSNDQRQTFVISFNPETDSLDDLATAFSAIPNLSATVRPDGNQFQITTQPGITFDFAGGLESVPDLSSFTGTSNVALSGIYTGTVNEDLTVQIEGTGDVGRGNNLFANVYSSGGALLARVNIGEGYEADTPIELDDGVRFSLSAGTVNDGDQFTTRLAGDPDETGLMGALGQNAFFTGTDAQSIRINRALVDDPDRIATGRSGEAADTSNLGRFLEIADEAVMPGGRTLSQFTSEISTEIGFEIKSNETLSVSLTTFKLQLEQQQDSISGVDLNEELVYLQQYQQAFEAAARIIQTTDEMMNELLSIFR